MVSRSPVSSPTSTMLTTMSSTSLAFLEGLGDGFAFADRLVDALVHAFEDRVGGRVADDAQGFEDGHARGDERPQRARGPGHGGLLDELPHDRHPQLEPVEGVGAALAHADQL